MHVCVYDILSIHLFINGHVGCFGVLAIVNNAAMRMRGHVFRQDIDFFPVDIYSEVGELVDHRVALLLIF